MQPLGISQQCCYVIRVSTNITHITVVHFVSEWNEQSCLTHHSTTSAMLRCISVLFNFKSPKPPLKCVCNPSTTKWVFLNTAKADLCSENSSQIESSMIITGKINSQTTVGLILTLDIFFCLWKYTSLGWDIRPPRSFGGVPFWDRSTNL